jgi:hypothetical protein
MRMKKNRVRTHRFRPSYSLCFGDPERIRTSNQQNRNLPFYPVELRSQKPKVSTILIIYKKYFLINFSTFFRASQLTRMKVFR